MDNPAFYQRNFLYKSMLCSIATIFLVSCSEPTKKHDMVSTPAHINPSFLSTEIGVTEPCNSVPAPAVAFVLRITSTNFANFSDRYVKKTTSPGGTDEGPECTRCDARAAPHTRHPTPLDINLEMTNAPVLIKISLRDEIGRAHV